MKTVNIKQSDTFPRKKPPPYGEVGVEESQRKLRKNRTLISLIIILSACTMIVLFFQVFRKESFISSVGNQILASFTDKDSLINTIWTPTLQNSERFTSVLIIGLDTREVYYDGEDFVPLVSKVDGDRNTDTIMQVIYDYENGDVFMVSFPRDLGVDILEACMEHHGKINAVYDIAEQSGCSQGGVGVLSSTVSNITGVEVNYYTIVTLDAFEKIINTVGELDAYGNRGIYVDIEKDLYEAYPNDRYGYDPIYFPAGRQFLTAHEALQYARSRQQTSDFDRARRQQQVIKAVKDRVLSSETLTSPGTLYDMLEIFKEEMQFSEFGLNEIRAALILAEGLEDSDIHRIVLDVDFGGRNVYIKKYVARPTGYYYMGPIHWQECGDTDAFCRVREQLEIIYDNPEALEQQQVQTFY